MQGVSANCLQLYIGGEVYLASELGVSNRVRVQCTGDSLMAIDSEHRVQLGLVVGHGCPVLVCWISLGMAPQNDTDHLLQRICHIQLRALDSAPEPLQSRK